MSEIWPDLTYSAWRDTAATLQLWTQIVGKVRLALTPWLNHSWQVPLYVTARGLGTSPDPGGRRILEIEFDFIDHRLLARTSRGDERALRAGAANASPTSTGGRWTLLRDIGVEVAINEMPNEVPESDPLFGGPHPRGLRRGGGASLLARARADRPRLQAVSQRLPRQGEPRAFLLGQLRPRGDALLRPAGAAASRRRAGPARRGHPRSLFARGQQRRLLAGQRRLPAGGLLLLRLSGAAGLPRPAASRPERASTLRSASSSCPTIRCAPPATRTRCCSISSPPPTPRRRTARAGTAPPSNARWECPRGLGRYSVARQRRMKAAAAPERDGGMARQDAARAVRQCCARPTRFALTSSGATPRWRCTRSAHAGPRRGDPT